MISRSFSIYSAIVVSIATLVPGAISATKADNLEGKVMNKSVQDFISQFRRGEHFHHNDNVTGLIAGGRANRISLDSLRKELASGNTDVRANIVRLLEKLGRETEPSEPGKFAIIRDQIIIRILVVEGFSKDDAASIAAAKTLLTYCRPADLAVYNDIYAQSLQQGDTLYLEIAAKAKTTKALDFVNLMAKSPSLREDPERAKDFRITQAALGNETVETEFIDAVRDAEKNAPPAPANRFYDVGAAKDGTLLGKRLLDLGRIGTRRSLLVVCEYLRTPLKSYIRNVSEHSVRHDALAALRYNFPDEQVLFGHHDLAGWSSAEQFCVDRLSAVFDGATPDIPPARAYPR